MTTIQSFSGAHPYRPQCVIDAIVNEWLEDGLDVTKMAVEMAATITAKIDAGTCPRCDGVLDLDMCARAKARAVERGETLTDVVRRALRAYVEEET